MHSIERYTRHIVATYPSPPRPGNWWFVMRHAPEPYQFPIVFFMLLLWMVVEYRNLHTPLSERSTEYYVLLVLLVIGVAQVVYRNILVNIYRYGFGIIYGKYTIAHVVALSQHKNTRGVVVQGVCEVRSDHARQQLTFTLDRFRCGAWFERVKPGDGLQVLLHPDKPMIMVTFGMVPTEALQSSITEHTDSPLVPSRPVVPLRRRSHPGYPYIIMIIIVLLLLMAPLVYDAVYRLQRPEMGLVQTVSILWICLGLYRGHAGVRHLVIGLSLLIGTYAIITGLRLVQEQPWVGFAFIAGGSLCEGCAFILARVTAVRTYFGDASSQEREQSM